MSKPPKINVTKDYGLFHHHKENRNVDEPAHRALLASMKKYGFLATMPIICFRDSQGKLIIKDGQHRHHFAMALGLPIYWVESDQDYDVPEVARTGKAWRPLDFAVMHCTNGMDDYRKGIEFADKHGLTITRAFCLLAGTTTFTNFERAFYDGDFVIKDQAWADKVAGIYTSIVKVAPNLKGARFLEACMAVCRVKAFDPKRLISGCEGWREHLVTYATREAYLKMLEEVYNFRKNKQNWYALQLEAERAMASRNATAPKSSSN